MSIDRALLPSCVGYCRQLGLILIFMQLACGRIGYDLGSIADDDGIGSALLSSLTLTSTQPENLVPAFASATSSYVSAVSLTVESLTLTATAMDPAANVDIVSLASGTGAASGLALLPLGATHVEVVVTATTGETKSYQVAVSRAGELEQDEYLKSSNTERNDLFGWSVAVSGDTLVVSARQESGGAAGVGGDQSDNSVSAAGAVYVFVRVGGEWSQQAYIKASNPGERDWFGSDVALSGDTLAVAAYLEDSGAVGIDGDGDNNTADAAGAVYVFTRTAGQWSQQAYIKASNTGAVDEFGTSLALEGDTLAVGAYLEDSLARGVGGDESDNSAVSVGAVYVFDRQGDTWSQQAYLKASNSEQLDSFGYSVALSGDTLAVGAIGEDSAATGVGGDEVDNSASESGAVYMFTRDASQEWSQQAYIKASNTDNGDFFGKEVSLSGDTLVVGATREASRATGIGGDQSNNLSSYSGAVYVFTRSSTSWSQQAYVKASNSQGSDGFGSSLAIDGNTLAVGSYLEDSNATGSGGDQSDNSEEDAGAVYLFTRSEGLWSQQAYLKASNSSAGYFFGYDLALWGGTLVVGSYREFSGTTGDETDTSAPSSGAVYIFE